MKLLELFMDRILYKRQYKRPYKRQIAALSGFAVAVCFAGGCGVSGSSGKDTSVSKGMTVSCAPETVNTGKTAQCTATGQAGTAVTWTATAGTITSSGLFTAPISAAQVTVKAVDGQDSSRLGSVVVTVQVGVPLSKHVVMVMEENRSYEEVVGNTHDWSKLNGMMAQGALPTNYYANAHFSIGNYFELTTGQTLTRDDTSTQIWDVDNIARRMLAAGVSFRVYAEGVPRGYTGGNTGDYVIRHNPFAMLSDVAGNKDTADEVLQPFSQFAVDAANHKLPEFSFIIPDLVHDSHSANAGIADGWLQTYVVNLLAKDPAFQAGGDGVLMVNFDESEVTDIANGGGHVSPVLWGPIVKSGYKQTSSTLYQHQSMLATVMELLNLPNPLADAGTAPVMTEFFVQK